jgi:hypothetical protein
MIFIENPQKLVNYQIMYIQKDITLYQEVLEGLMMTVI